MLVVGTEIAEGIIADTHTQYLATLFRRLGVTLAYSTIVPDDDFGIEASLRFALERAELVVVTGGLGPTSDDRTREVIASVAGRSLVFHDDIWQRLRKRWRHWHGTNVEPAESNKRQAYIPEGFDVLTNDAGTAPGFIGTIGSTRVAALPGPPRELRHVVEHRLLPLLEAELSSSIPGSDVAELRGTAFLVGESSLEDALQAAAGELGGTEAVRWGTRAEPYRIGFYLRGGTADGRQRVFEGLASRLGRFRIRGGDVEPAANLLGALTRRGLTIVTAESCTGGMISTLLTEIPGSSEAVWGGVVSYANAAKTKVLAVPESVLLEHGAVSRQTVESMVAGARELSGADVAIAVSGVAGPSGGTPEKPVGTVWIAVGADSVKTRQFRFVGGRERVRRKSAIVGLLMAADLVEGLGAALDVDLDTYELS